MVFGNNRYHRLLIDGHSSKTVAAQTLQPNICCGRFQENYCRPWWFVCILIYQFITWKISVSFSLSPNILLNYTQA